MTSETWDRAAELPPDVVRVLRHKRVGPTAIVATTDEDGSPHTAPFGSLIAVDKRTLRLGCDRRHDTYSNIKRNGLVMASLISPPNIAVSIKGKARVLKEKMNLLNTDAVIEIQVEEVKNDFLPGTAIETGVNYSASKEILVLIEKSIAEIDSA